VFDDDHNLVLDRSAIDAYEENLSCFKQIYQKIKANSYLLSLLSERIYLYKYQEAHKDKDEVSIKDDKNKGLGLFSELNIYRRGLPPPWKEAVEITKEIILIFKKAVEEHGSKFVLVSLTNAEQVHPDLGNELKNQYGNDLDYEQPDQILDTFARENEVLYLRLVPAFRDYHYRTGQYLHGFGTSHGGHWNQEGHRLAAEETLQFFKDQHLVPLDSETS
jgi:hypothetical protein